MKKLLLLLSLLLATNAWAVTEKDFFSCKANHVNSEDMLLKIEESFAPGVRLLPKEAHPTKVANLINLWDKKNPRIKSPSPSSKIIQASSLLLILSQDL